MFSATTLAGCNSTFASGVLYWTAGQRVDPSTESTFIWRVTTDDGDLVSAMTYTNWGRGQPDYYKQREHCMDLIGGLSYTWNDHLCSRLYCSVCEIDT